MVFKIDERKIGSDQPPYIIAELSANHNGKIERALETIKAARRCGADAVKLQTYTAETMTIDCDKDEFAIRGGLWDGYKLFDLYKWAETPFEWHADLFACGREEGITVFSTPFDETAVDLLESLDAPAYKIASFELTDLPLIQYVAATGKPIIMSTGMGSEDEIEEAVQTARDAGCSEIALLHCISSYPAPLEQANVRQLAELAKRFGTLPGLSDHTLGTVASVAAVSLGASVIEKHFTLDRADKGPDSEFSIEPDELERTVPGHPGCLGRTWASRLPTARGRGRKPKIQTFHIFCPRPLRPVPSLARMMSAESVRAFGISPKYFDEIVGKTLKTDVDRGTPARWELFE